MYLTYYVRLAGIKEVTDCKMHGVESFKINVTQMFAYLSAKVSFRQFYFASSLPFEN